MDQNAYEAAKAAYQQGDWARAASMLTTCKQPNEVFGAADHLLGNSLMKLGMFVEAANAYAAAMMDITYGKKGALACNRGRALLAAGEIDQAILSLNEALQDDSYSNPYKAQMTLGNAYMQKSQYTEAGVAFRNAAIDEANPNPARALVKLGECFMFMGRPLDAVEALRTALDFSTPQESQNAIYASLGAAYVAANKMSEAVDAYNHAVSDGSYMLNPADQASFEAAKNACMAVANRTPSETDQLLAAAGYSGGAASENFDPLDPMGKSGEIMPSPDDTGFFSISEQDLINYDKQNKTKKKKKKSGVAKFFTVLLVLIILLAAAGGFAYYKGYGYPSSEAVVTQLFQAKTDGTDIGEVLAGSISAEGRKSIDSVLPAGAKVSIAGEDRSMTNSKVYAKAVLPQGGTLDFEIDLIREGISWKVTKVQAVYPAQQGKAPSFAGKQDVPGQKAPADTKPSQDSNTNK